MMKSFRLFCLAAVAMALLTIPAMAGPLGKTIKGGISYAKITHDLSDFDYEMGIVVGLAMSYDLAPGFSLQPELLYVQQGAKNEYEEMNEMGELIGSGDYIMDLDYIQIPVLAKVDLPVAGSVLPSIIAGPAIAFKINAEGTYEGSTGDVSADLEDVNSTNLSLIVGLGLKLGAGPAGVNVEARYNYGLSKIYDGPIDIQNRSIQGLVGFSF